MFTYRLWRGHLGARFCLRWPHGVIIPQSCLYITGAPAVVICDPWWTVEVPE